MRFASPFGGVENLQFWTSKLPTTVLFQTTPRCSSAGQNLLESENVVENRRFRLIHGLSSSKNLKEELAKINALTCERENEGIHVRRKCRCFDCTFVLRVITDGRNDKSAATRVQRFHVFFVETFECHRNPFFLRARIIPYGVLVPHVL